jgi:hypothetical protein
MKRTRLIILLISILLTGTMYFIDSDEESYCSHSLLIEFILILILIFIILFSTNYIFDKSIRYLKS